MLVKTPAVIALLLPVLFIVASTATATAEEPDLKNVPIQDYDPVSMLKAGETPVERA